MPTERPYDYLINNAHLEIFPVPDEGQQQEVTLTWRWMYDTLRGVTSFVDAYPGLWCGWEIFEIPDDEQVGSGLLMSFW